MAANWKVVLGSERRSLLEGVVAPLKLHDEMCVGDMLQELLLQKLCLMCTTILVDIGLLLNVTHKKSLIFVLCCFYRTCVLISIYFTDLSIISTSYCVYFSFAFLSFYSVVLLQTYGDTVNQSFVSLHRVTT